MLLQKLMALSRPRSPEMLVGLEWRPERFALVSIERTSIGTQPVVHAHASLPLPVGGAAAAETLRDTWQRLGLPGQQVAVSVPSPAASLAIRPAPCAAAPLADAVVSAEIMLPAMNGQPARCLTSTTTRQALDGLLALLAQAGLEAVRVQPDCLAMLTACSFTPAWQQDVAQTRALILINDHDIQWCHLSTEVPIPQSMQTASNPAELQMQLAQAVPALIFLAGSAEQTQPLLTSLQTRWPNTRYCSNPFAGIRLAHEQDRRPLTARAAELFVAYGLALGAA